MARTISDIYLAQVGGRGAYDLLCGTTSAG
jgi:hypothetical protein